MIQDRVAIIYGRFQPLTAAHYDMINRVLKMYQNVFVFPIQAESTYKITAKTLKGKNSERERKIYRSPFPLGLRTELILKAFPEMDSRHVLKLKTGSIEYVYDQLKKLYPKLNIDKMDVYAGKDEVEGYEQQVKYMGIKPEFKNVDVQVKTYEAGTREEISATKLREAILKNDYETYAKLVAPPLRGEATYNRLRKVLEALMSFKIEANMPLFMKLLDEAII